MENPKGTDNKKEGRENVHHRIVNARSSGNERKASSSGGDQSPSMCIARPSPLAVAVTITDGFSGTLDVWPGGKCSPSPRNNPTRLATTRSANTDEKGREMLRRNFVDVRSSKPKFLAELERQLEQELSRIECSETPSEGRLQVFKECFQNIINEFKSYKPILTRIKTEYDLMLKSYSSRLQSVPHMKSQLAIFQAESTDVVNQLEKKHQEKEKKYKEMMKDFQQEKTDLNESKKLLEEKCKSLEEKMSEMREEIDDQHESNHTLYMALKRHEGDLQEREEKKHLEQVHILDIETTNAKLQKKYSETLEVLHQTNKRINQMTSNEEVDFLQSQLELKSNQFEELQETYKTLNDSYQNLLHRYESVSKERTILLDDKQEYTKAREGAQTPRPDWNKAIELKYLPEGLDVATKSTQDLVAQLYFEIEELRDRNNELLHQLPDLGEGENRQNHKDKTSFTALGIGPDVPRYLRYEGKIRNRKLPKKECEMFVKEVWKAKYKKPEDHDMPLEDFVFKYLQSKYGIQSMIAEVGYNLKDSLERYRYDADCELFLMILTNQCSEEVYVDQMNMLERFKHDLIQIDLSAYRSASGKPSGKMKRADLFKLLAEFFPTKDPIRHSTLKKALILNDPRQELHYLKLFEEDREGNQGQFIECLRDQHLEEIFEFMEELENRLKEKDNGYGAVKLSDIRQDLQEIDPDKPLKEINEAISTGFGVTMIRALRDDMMISIEAFMKKLRASTLLKRSGAKSLQ